MNPIRITPGGLVKEHIEKMHKLYGFCQYTRTIEFMILEHKRIHDDITNRRKQKKKSKED